MSYDEDAMSWSLRSFRLTPEQQAELERIAAPMSAFARGEEQDAAVVHEVLESLPFVLALNRTIVRDLLDAELPLPDRLVLVASIAGDAFRVLVDQIDRELPEVQPLREEAIRVYGAAARVIGEAIDELAGLEIDRDEASTPAPYPFRWPFADHLFP